jgi:hypothetical protein
LSDRSQATDRPINPWGGEVVGDESKTTLIRPDVRGNSSLEPLRNSIALRQIPTFIQGQNVAGFGFWLEMQLDDANIELAQHQFDAMFDGRMVGAVAGDKFLDHRTQCRGRKLPMGDVHGVSLPPNEKTITASLLL